MKVIVAGGRNYNLTDEDRGRLAQIPITEVVSGEAPGADADGEMYADANNIPVTRFPADWAKYKNAAGPIRNKNMAAYADAVVLFPGGKGTDSMYREAQKAGIEIFDFRRKRGAGQWNAYVEAGADREERRARLAEVPPDLQASVIDHVKTVFALQSEAKKKRERKQ